MNTWIIPYLIQHRRRLIQAVLVSVLASVCAAGLLFTSGYLISKAALRPENILMIYVPIVGVRTFGIFRAVFQYAGRLISHDAILRILSEMRAQLYNKLEPLALFLRQHYQTGDLLGILSDDMEHLQDIYLRTVLPGAAALIVYGLWIAAIGYLDGWFALLMASYLLILLVVFPLLSLVWTRQRRRQMLTHRHLLYEKLTDAVLGIGDWMLSGRQAAFLSQHEGIERMASKEEHSLDRFRHVRDFLSQLLIGGAVLLVLSWTGGMAAGGHISPTLIAAFVLVIFSISETLLPVSEAVERLPQYDQAFERLRQVSQSQRAAAAEDEKLVQLTDPQNVTIHADNLFYRYSSDNNWALKSVSLTIKQGEWVALIGRSGAGKSTLAHLIYGALTPTEGTVTLGGIPCDQFGRSMSQHISVLNQSPHLFDTSVLNNLKLGNESATSEQIMEAAKGACLHEKIERLAHGYDTQMHEAGAIFSGGEKERLALARVLLQDNPIVILDEPTVGLDPITERALLQTIFATLKGKTLIWITHHLTGMERMDQIIFMENGQLEMRGTHKQLLANESRYRRLYTLDVPDNLRARLN
ncbi:MAG: thiol reductant ABC exporter subunit CydC [Sporolactobacillus sp.]